MGLLSRASKREGSPARSSSVTPQRNQEPANHEPEPPAPESDNKQVVRQSLLGRASAAAGRASAAAGQRLSAMHPTSVVRGAKRHLYKSIQDRVGRKLVEVYTERIKHTITPDRRYPWFVRVAIHELVDEIWEAVQDETRRAFEKMIEATDANKGAPSPPRSPPPSPPEDADPRAPASLDEDPPGTGPTRLVVTLERARGLRAADRNGLSDPYARLTIGGQKRRSRTVKRSLETRCLSLTTRSGYWRRRRRPPRPRRNAGVRRGAQGRG